MPVRVGIVAPGSMGAAVGASLVRQGHQVVAVVEGRSSATRARAAAAGIEPVTDLASLVRCSDVLVSIVPPEVAIRVAAEIAEAAEAAGVSAAPPVYVDANAISPRTARSVALTVSAAGLAYVDGAIIGGPPGAGSVTAMYLSGATGDALVAQLSTSDLHANWLGEDPTAASALKMAYAAWTKGSSALLIAIRSAARSCGVEAALVEEWQRSQPGVLRRSGSTPGVAGRAWRWVAEMQEIAQTFSDVGVPGDALLGAAEIYRRLADFKDIVEPPALDDVMAAVTGRPTGP